MKPISNFDSAKEEAKKQAESVSFEKLPIGLYVAKIVNVRFEEGKDGASDKIVLAYDIAEGDQKEYFKKRFEADTSENKKWKGVIKLYVPKDDGTDSEWAVKNFAKVITNFELSNPGFVWDWDEKKLKGKLIGVAIGEVEDTIEGRICCWTEYRWSLTAEDARNNKGKVPEKKFKNGNVPAATNEGSVTDNGEWVANPDKEDIPF